MLKKKLDKRKRRESGQTLILAMLAMLVLVLAIVFLLDLQSVIRVKIKAQTAVDAAALAGANWQKESLNLIGELNLVKACTVLISDYPIPHPVPSDFLEEEEDLGLVGEASDLLTEMQVRVSFVGPLIGLGAAQQAAKNNGLNYSSNFGEAAQNHYSRVLNDDMYADETILSQNIRGYEWRDSYAAMLSNILEVHDGKAKGFAVAPNSHFMGMPSLTSDPPDFIGYLQVRYIYEAIHANYWCALRHLLRMDFGSEGHKWWGDIELMIDTSSFPGESEYLTLDIEFFEGVEPYYRTDDAGAFDAIINNSGESERSALVKMRERYDRYNPDDDSDSDNKYDPLPVITWATFGSSWTEYGQDTIDAWSRYLYGDFSEGYAYYGAVTKMWAEVPLNPLSGQWVRSDSKTGGADGTYLGDAMRFGGTGTVGTGINQNADRLRNAEVAMQQALLPLRASALAKPYGKISTQSNGVLPPCASGMVLPVFDRAVVIPVALEDPGGFDPFDLGWYYYLTEYLPTLGTTNNLEDMPDIIANGPYSGHWGYFAPYHNALLKLNDPEWRQRGIDWLETDIGYDTYDEFGNVTGHVTILNEDNCDYWPGGGSGNRSGPSVLH